MLRSLQLINVGPAPLMTLELGTRLNLLTGDNGLGKSFLLDIAWWALTRKWPAEVNKSLPAGLMARPYGGGKATIELAFTGKTAPVSHKSSFDREEQAWTSEAKHPSNPGLVLYAQADGSFAIWDPARNYWRRKGFSDLPERPPAYVFNAREVWDGLRDKERGLLCNGLISDWAGWQKEKGAAFNSLHSALAALSPSNDEKIEPGELTRISLDDPRDIPTLKMPYGQSVPVLHASAGIRRIIALAYLLVWAWEEHRQASRLLGQKTASQLIFLIDEIEAHLHPKWQRRIISSLLSVMEALAENVAVQVIATTHSPLVLASVEPFFDSERDAWFDLDIVRGEKNKDQVELSRREFVRRGDACNWLTSEAFDLSSTRSPEYERLLAEASSLIEKPNPTRTEVKQMHQELIAALNPKDSFLFRWRAICEKKGLLK